VKINKAHKARIYPTTEQRGQLAQHFGAARWIYNHFLHHKTEQYKINKKSDSFVMMCHGLTKLKKKPETGWLCDVGRQCAANSIANLDAAYNNFYKKKSSYPKFKKKRGRQSFRISAPFCRAGNDGVAIPIIGILKCEVKLPVQYKLWSITISKTTTGKYFASINYEMEIADPIADKTKPMIGLDFGLKHFITTSDGIKVEHPRPLAKKLRRLRRLNRLLSHKKLGSKRRSKAKHRLALQHERITNIRSDFLHKLSRRLVGENQAIYVEDLNIEGMKQRFGRQVGDAGWSEFVKQLSYKGLWYGCDVFKIDRFFPSSKTCSKCGEINRGLQLSDRSWRCNECCVVHDRDVNAASNILVYGRADRNLRSQRDAKTHLVEARNQSNGEPYTI